MTTTNPYDEVPYRTIATPTTHPDRMATIGTLFGLSPVPATRCRVLEIGCGNANNLIPMAFSLPESSFVGIDLAGSAIEAGKAFAAPLGLRNLTLLQTFDTGPHRKGTTRGALAARPGIEPAHVDKLLK